MEDQPVLTPMRASLNRPQLLMGGDRELVLLTGLLAALMAVSVMSLLSFLIAGASFVVIVAVLAKMGKEDPLMRRVYARHLAYKDFYPAKSGVAVAGKASRRG
jgi:type IV secretory pathway TrbD component